MDGVEKVRAAVRKPKIRMTHTHTYNLKCSKESTMCAQLLRLLPRRRHPFRSSGIRWTLFLVLIHIKFISALEIIFEKVGGEKEIFGNPS